MRRHPIKRRPPIVVNEDNTALITDIKARIIYWYNATLEQLGEGARGLPPVPSKEDQQSKYNQLFG
jgi:hypothetical protein